MTSIRFNFDADSSRVGQRPRRERNISIFVGNLQKAHFLRYGARRSALWVTIVQNSDVLVAPWPLTDSRWVSIKIKSDRSCLYRPEKMY